jgi:pheromone shutdown protein TraB
MSLNILLIGTAHYELKGAERLRRALEKESPNIITIESSDAAENFKGVDRLNYMNQILLSLKEEGLNPDVLSQLETYLRNLSFYESKVSIDYANQKRIPYHLVDDFSAVEILRKGSEETLRNISHLASVGFIDLNPDSLNSYFTHFYNTFKTLIQHSKLNQDLILDLLDPLRETHVGKRDSYMAERIIKQAELSSGKLIHVGGLVHILNDPQGDTLYEKLKHLNPERRVLSDY